MPQDVHLVLLQTGEYVDPKTQDVQTAFCVALQAVLMKDPGVQMVQGAGAVEDAMQKVPLGHASFVDVVGQ